MLYISGKFLGKNYVFDRRIAMESNNKTVVGRCVSCSAPYDKFQGMGGGG